MQDGYQVLHLLLDGVRQGARCGLAASAPVVTDDPESVGQDRSELVEGPHGAMTQSPFHDDQGRSAAGHLVGDRSTVRRDGELGGGS